MTAPVRKQCPICARQFARRSGEKTKYFNKRRTCGRLCSIAMRIARTRAALLANSEKARGPDRACESCGEIIRRIGVAKSNSVYNRRRFCNRRCAQNWRVKIGRTKVLSTSRRCVVCGDVIDAASLLSKHGTKQARTVLRRRQTCGRSCAVSLTRTKVMKPIRPGDRFGSTIVIGVGRLVPTKTSSRLVFACRCDRSGCNAMFDADGSDLNSGNADSCGAHRAVTRSAFGASLTAGQMAALCGSTLELMHRRLRSGMSPETAIVMPSKRNKKLKEAMMSLGTMPKQTRPNRRRVAQ